MYFDAFSLLRGFLYDFVIFWETNWEYSIFLSCYARFFSYSARISIDLSLTLTNFWNSDILILNISPSIELHWSDYWYTPSVSFTPRTWRAFTKELFTCFILTNSLLFSYSSSEDFLTCFEKMLFIKILPFTFSKLLSRLCPSRTLRVRRNSPEEMI